MEFSNILKEQEYNSIKGWNKIIRTALIGFLIVLAGIALLLSYKAFTLGPVGNDAGYYISVGIRISEGWIPFKDIYLEYPPIGFYLYSIAARLSSGFKTENYYFITYLFILGSSLLVYLIGLKLRIGHLLSAIAGFFTLALTLYCQGYLPLLEPFTAFFYLSAILLVFKGLENNSNLDFFLAGALVFLSFFSKQFGLIVLPAIFVYILISNYSTNRKIAINLLMFAGFSLCATLVVLYYVIHGVEVKEIIIGLSGKGDGSSSYGVRSVGVMMKAIFEYVLRAELFLLVLPVLLLLDHKFQNDKGIIFLLILNLCAFLPLYIGNFTHYYQLIVPFSVLLGVYILHYGLEKSSTTKLSVLSIVSVAFSFLLMLILILKISINFERTYYKYSRQDEFDIAADLLKAVPPKSQVYMIGAEEMYAICNYLPVQPKKYGYLFQGWFEPKDLVALLEPGQYLIVPDYNFDLYKPYVGQLTPIPAGDRMYVFRR